MQLLAIIAIPLFGLIGIALLFGILSPVPILRPGLAALARGATGRLPQGIPGRLRRLGGRNEARIAALERRNGALEAQIAELTDCMLRSLAISMETQRRLEAGTPEPTRSRAA